MELQRRGIPFLVLTGYDRSQLDDAVLREATLLGKPLQRRALRKALKALLSP